MNIGRKKVKQLFTIVHKDKNSFARTGIIHTPHGEIQTPAFVPVATQATIKGVTMDQFRSIGASSLLCNTYHLYLRPGDRLVKRFGGLHSFMDWNGPLWTDSGGFQVFSLDAGMKHGVSKLGKEKEKHSGILKNTRMPEQYIASHNKHTNKLENVDMLLKKQPKPFVRIFEEGVVFSSHIDGSRHMLTPEASMRIQGNLGADLIFSFDECTSPTHDYRYTKQSMERTHRWAKRSLDEYKKIQKKRKNKQVLFGIVQGGDHKDLREKSAEVINAMEFEGVGIGGYVGDSKSKLYDMLGWVIPRLDEEKPKHLLGIGAVEDIFEAVLRGIDTFDCVIPTRYGRSGTIFTRDGVLHIENARYKNERAPLDRECPCYTCATTSRGYLSHLFRAHEMLGPTLATIHNLSFMERLMSDIRQGILHNNYSRVRRIYRKAMRREQK